MTANGWSVGDFIEAGEVLGLEGDVGRASGPHVHKEVGRPNDRDDLTPFTARGGFMVPNFGINLVPRVRLTSRRVRLQRDFHRHPGT